MYAPRCTYHGALKTTPGGLAFGRDMILNIPLVTDLELLQERRQQLIDQHMITANAKRFSYDYRVGDEVLKLVYKPNIGLEMKSSNWSTSQTSLILVPLGLLLLNRSMQMELFPSGSILLSSNASPCVVSSHITGSS